MFIPTGGGPSAGANIINGKYAIGTERGVVPGTNRIEIHAIHKTGGKVPSPIDPDQLVDEIGELIPPKYHRNSILQEDVAVGDNTKDFALTSESAPDPPRTGDPKPERTR
jgi:hypothetical protein